MNQLKQIKEDKEEELNDLIINLKHLLDTEDIRDINLTNICYEINRLISDLYLIDNQIKINQIIGA